MSKGDCYEAAGRYLLDHPTDNLVLVHAEVTGQGAVHGVKFGHAFILDGNDVIDVSNGRNIRMDKNVYFVLGQIGEFNPKTMQMDTRKGNVHYYTYKEALEKMGKYEHWGPWDLKTSSGL